MECDNGYEIRKHIKDNNALVNNENRGKEPIVQPQRSSSSPTSNIWLRLIEDEENIGNVDSFFFSLVVLSYDATARYPLSTFLSHTI